MQYKIDLHTHSIISQDGGITRAQYASILDQGILNCIAITDHNETKFALEMAKEFGEKIIVGQEIASLDGEIIGLYLHRTIMKNLTAEQTIKHIHEQGGLVYIPHPFEAGRSSLQLDTLQKNITGIDIIEVFNARSRWRGRSEKALEFAIKHNKAISAGSDAHCKIGLGSAFSIMSQMPTKKSLLNLLDEGSLQKKFAPAISYLCPAVNKIKHKLHYV
jgi:predicted metal-dependent phosphoesterase TrpH